MADFISNSAILPAILPSAVLAAVPNSDPGREKWQTCTQSLTWSVMLVSNADGDRGPPIFHGNFECLQAAT